VRAEVNELVRRHFGAACQSWACAWIKNGCRFISLDQGRAIIWVDFHFAGIGTSLAPLAVKQARSGIVESKPHFVRYFDEHGWQTTECAGAILSRRG
jgi:hypothetical protein